MGGQVERRNPGPGDRCSPFPPELRSKVQRIGGGSERGRKPEAETLRSWNLSHGHSRKLRPPPQELTKPQELVLPLSPLSLVPQCWETPLKVAAPIPVQEGEGEVGMMGGEGTSRLRESRGPSPSPNRSRKTSPASHPALTQSLDPGVHGLRAPNPISGPS